MSEYLDFGDPRLMASSRIIIAPGNNSVVPKVVFVKDSIDYQVDASVRVFVRCQNCLRLLNNILSYA